MSSVTRWAWRGVRARGWTAVLSVVLIALVLAANVLVFSATDALVLNPYPYREPERLVTLRMSSHPTLLQLGSLSDLFSGVEAYLPGSTIVTGDRDPVRVTTSFVTPGLLSLFGVDPGWGRGFVESDRTASEPPPALLDRDLARDRFGDPRRAIGQMLETSDRPLLVIGVMPAGFRFPDGTTRIWRVLDAPQYAGEGVVIQGFPGFWPVARLVPGVPLAHAEATVVERLPAHRPAPNRLALTPIRRAIGGMVMSSSAGLVFAGIIVGSAAALGSSRLIASQMFGVSPTDISTYLIAAAAIAAAALAATWHPALQAARIDPVVTLRTE